jgi:hypothetical protein
LRPFPCHLFNKKITPKNNRKAEAPYFPTQGKPSPVVLADGKIYGGISMEIYETSGNNSLRLSV